MADFGLGLVVTLLYGEEFQAQVSGPFWGQTAPQSFIGIQTGTRITLKPKVRIRYRLIGFILFKNVNVFRPANVFKLLRPDRDAYFTKMGRAQQVHVSPRLADASADGQRDLIVENRLVIRQL